MIKYNELIEKINNIDSNTDIVELSKIKEEIDNFHQLDNTGDLQIGLMELYQKKIVELLSKEDIVEEIIEEPKNEIVADKVEVSNNIVKPKNNRLKIRFIAGSLALVCAIGAISLIKSKNKGEDIPSTSIENIDDDEPNNDYVDNSTKPSDNHVEGYKSINIEENEFFTEDMANEFMVAAAKAIKNELNSNASKVLVERSNVMANSLDYIIYIYDSNGNYLDTFGAFLFKDESNNKMNKNSNSEGLLYLGNGYILEDGNYYDGKFHNFNYEDARYQMDKTCPSSLSRSIEDNNSLMPYYPDSAYSIDLDNNNIEEIDMTKYYPNENNDLGMVTTMKVKMINHPYESGKVQQIVTTDYYFDKETEELVYQMTDFNYDRVFDKSTVTHMNQNYLTDYATDNEKYTVIDFYQEDKCCSAQVAYFRNYFEQVKSLKTYADIRDLIDTAEQSGKSDLVCTFDYKEYELQR